MRDFVITTRLKLRRSWLDKWYQEGAQKTWAGATAYYSEPQAVSSDLTKVTMVVVKSRGERFSFEMLARQYQSGEWWLYSIAMIEPSFNATSDAEKPQAD